MTDAAFAEAPAPAGHNNPPPDALGAMTVHVDDLYVEAANWCDGQEIENADQAAEVDRLIDLFKEAITDCEAAREVEKKPHADKVKAIQESWYPLIGETQKITGKAIRAKKALLEVKSVWGRKQQALRDAEAQRLRDEAAKKAAEAAQAARDAAGDLSATEAAEDLIRDAQSALKAAAQAEKPSVKGMRDHWVIKGFAPWTDDAGKVVEGRGALLRHYLKTAPELLLDACMELARQDVQRGKRTIPGLIIENERRAV
jgi:hypothetical protein